MTSKLYLVSSNRGRRPLMTGNGAPPAHARRGCHGRIVELFVGGGHGFIRMGDRRDIYFHRGDLLDSSRFNGFKVGDTVAFELLEDRFSGARALHVRRRTAR